VIIAKLQSLSELLPPDVREVVAKLGRLCVGRSGKPIDTEKITIALHGALKGTDEALQVALMEAQAKVKGADYEREGRVEAQAAAEAQLDELRRAVAERKLALGGSDKIIQKRHNDVAVAKAAQRSAMAEIKAVAGKKRQLEAAEKDAYEPLRDEPAAGPDGSKRLTVLRKVGKVYGFHNELLSVAPAILKKELDKRRTFDNLVMRQLEVEFRRNVGSLNSEIQDKEQILAERASEVQAAHAAWINAKEEQKNGARALSQAEEALAAGKVALSEAQRRVRTFPTDMRKSLRNFSLAKARLDKFRDGPLAKFEKSLKPPVPEDDDHTEAENLQ